MALDDSIKTILSADSTLTTALAGGIHTMGDITRLGIHLANLAGLFDDGVLKPVCVIVPRDELPFGAVRDDEAQLLSTRQVVELHFYTDGDDGFAALSTARARAFALLHGTHGIAGYRVRWTLERVRQYSAVPRRACFERSDFECYRVKSAS